MNWTKIPKTQRAMTRRRIRPYVDRNDCPSSSRLAMAKGIEAPTMKRNIGMIMSQQVNPYQGCASWNLASKRNAGQRYPTSISASSRPPMIQTIVKPRRASRESNRGLCVATARGVSTASGMLANVQSLIGLDRGGSRDCLTLNVINRHRNGQESSTRARS